MTPSPVWFALLLGSAAQAACDAPEHRQFDFWLGRWEVRAAPQAPNADALLGHNHIEVVAAGCALLETWRGASSGLEGRSLNTYDRVSGRWHQFWTGADGTVLQLRGERDGEDMVLEGELPAAGGGVQRQRIRWSPGADGSVTQRWETSDDAGVTWQTSFLGIYRRGDP